MALWLRGCIGGWRSMDIKEAYLSKPWLKHYPAGVPENPNIPEMSVPELIDQLSDKYASKTALIFYGK